MKRTEEAPRPSFYWHQNTAKIRREIHKALRGYGAHKTLKLDELSYYVPTERWRFDSGDEVFEVRTSKHGPDNDPTTVLVARLIPSDNLASNAGWALTRAKKNLDDLRENLEEALMNMAQMSELSRETVRSYRATLASLPVLNFAPTIDALYEIETAAEARAEAAEAAEDETQRARDAANTKEGD